MATNSKIEWTEATWNPVTGCTRMSAGCDNCYAARMTFRLENMGQPNYQGLTSVNANGDRHFNGNISQSRTHSGTSCHCAERATYELEWAYP